MLKSTFVESGLAFRAGVGAVKEVFERGLAGLWLKGEPGERNLTD